MFNELLTKLKHYFISKRFLYLNLPYTVLGLTIIFLTSNKDGLLGSTLILILLIAYTIGDAVWNWAKKKKDHQNSDS